MLLAAEHRQHESYPKFLNYTFQSWFGEVDTEGNSLLHLAAKYQDNQGLLISGAIPGAALQMQRDLVQSRVQLCRCSEICLPSSMCVCEVLPVLHMYARLFLHAGH
ncbi:hypothetical protein AAC387_Pa05g2947 [Persea americana]